VSDASEVLVEEQDGVLVLTINRPHTRNALNATAAARLAEELDRFDESPVLQVAILTGAASTFSSGMDLVAYAQGDEPAVGDRGLAGIQYRGPRKPLIAAIEGYAVAGGLELALCCDLIVAASNAQLALTEVRHGLIAGGGGLIRLAQRAPYHVVMDLALTGRTITGEEAQQLGLVSRLSAPGAALTTARALAATIMRHPANAVLASKAVIQQVAQTDEATAWRLQRPYLEKVLQHEAARAGVGAFADRRVRPPQ
jgi:enoyl-CoA hydratase